MLRQSHGSPQWTISQLPLDGPLDGRVRSLLHIELDLGSGWKRLYFAQDVTRERKVLSN